MAHFFVKATLYPLMKLFFVKEIKGLENIPKKEPYIIVSNHASYIDGPLLLLTFLWHKNREVHFFVWKEMFKTPFRRFVFSKWFKQVSQDHSVEPAVHYVEKKEIVGIFPEGERTHTGKMERIKHTGLGVLVLKTKKPVVPIGIKGTFELWPWNQKWPKLRRIVTITIGKPMKFNLAMNKKNYKNITSKVMKQVAKLADNEYKW